MFKLIFVILLYSSLAKAVAKNCEKIGVLFQKSRDISGSEFRYGQEIIEGVSLASKVFKPKRCYSIESIDIGHSLESVRSALQAGVKNSIRVFIGLGLSKQVFAVLDLIEEHKLILFSPTASDSRLLDHKRIYLMHPSIDKIATETAIYLSKSNPKSICIFKPLNFTAGRLYVEILTQEMTPFRHIDVRTFEFTVGKIAEQPLIPKHAAFDCTHAILPTMERDAPPILDYLGSNLSTFFNLKTIIGFNGWGSDFLLLRSLRFERFKLESPVVFTPESIPEEFKKAIMNYFSNKSRSFPLSHLFAFSFDAYILLTKALDTCGDFYNLSDKGRMLCLSRQFPLVLSSGVVNQLTNNVLIRKIIFKNVKEREITQTK
jgi:hypothetical protein